MTLQPHVPQHRRTNTQFCSNLVTSDSPSDDPERVLRQYETRQSSGQETHRGTEGHWDHAVPVLLPGTHDTRTPTHHGPAKRRNQGHRGAAAGMCCPPGLQTPASATTSWAGSHLASPHKLLCKAGFISGRVSKTPANHVLSTAIKS